MAGEDFERKLVLAEFKAKDLETSSDESSKDDEYQPPDGGLSAWLQVFGVWFLIMNTWSDRCPLKCFCHLY